MSRLPRSIAPLAAATLLAAAGAATAAGESAVPWLLRSGDLFVGEQTFFLALGVRGREARGEAARAKAPEQLDRLRQRLLLAGAAVRRGLDGDPAVAEPLKVFRAAHLADLYQQEKVHAPARAAAKAAGGGPQAEAAVFKEERERLYGALLAGAERQFPAEVLLTSLPPAGTGGDQAVARVAGSEVRVDEVRRGLARVDHPGSRESTGGRVFMSVLNSLLASHRFTALAERDGFASRPEFAVALEDRRQRLLADRYLETVVYAAVRVTDAAIEERYARVKDTLARREEREISEILVADEALARAVAARLAAGAAFADMVREHSVGPTKEKGGSLGLLAPGETIPQLDAAIAALGAGQVSPPVRSAFGWHILRCERVVSGRVPPLEEERGRLEQALREEARAAALAGELARLAAEIPVQVNEKRYKEILESL